MCLQDPYSFQLPCAATAHKRYLGTKSSHWLAALGNKVLFKDQQCSGSTRLTHAALLSPQSWAHRNWAGETSTLLSSPGCSASPTLWRQCDSGPTACVRKGWMLLMTDDLNLPARRNVSLHQHSHGRLVTTPSGLKHKQLPWRKHLTAVEQKFCNAVASQANFTCVFLSKRQALSYLQQSLSLYRALLQELHYGDWKYLSGRGHHC